MQTAPMREEIVPTGDGRELMVLEVGDPNGYPVLHNHGTPSVGREVAHHGDAFASVGFASIAPDRPGYGRSTLVAGRPWWIGSTMCAPSSTTSDSTPSVWRATRQGVPSPARSPSPCRSRRSARSGRRRTPRRARRIRRRRDLRRGRPATGPDRVRGVLPDRTLGRTTPGRGGHAHRSGPDRDPRLDGRRGHGSGSDRTRGYFWTVSQPWGFEIADVATATRIWQGASDGLVPTRSAELYERDLQHAELTVLADETHLTVWRRAPELYARTFAP